LSKLLDATDSATSFGFSFFCLLFVSCCGDISDFVSLVISSSSTSMFGSSSPQAREAGVSSACMLPSSTASLLGFMGSTNGAASTCGFISVKKSGSAGGGGGFVSCVCDLCCCCKFLLVFGTAVVVGDVVVFVVVVVAGVLGVVVGVDVDSKYLSEEEVEEAEEEEEEEEVVEGKEDCGGDDEELASDGLLVFDENGGGDDGDGDGADGVG